MARAGAAVVLAFAVCCLLVAPAPARRTVDLPPRALHAVVDREAAAEPLLPKPAGGADCAGAAEQGAALAVPEEDPARGEEPRQRSSLLCLVFRCGGEPAHAGSALVARATSEKPQALDEWTQPAVAEKAEDEEADDVEERLYETDSDSDSDCDSDSDDEGEDGILGWLWRLADRF